MRKGFLLNSSNGDKKKSYDNQQMQLNQNSKKILELINQYTQLNFNVSTNLKTTLPNLDLEKINIQASIYAIILSDKELSYQAFDFIANNFNRIGFYYHENSTIIIIKNILAASYETIEQLIKGISHIMGNHQLQFEAIVSQLFLKLTEDINKKIGNDFKQDLMFITGSSLDLLQIATSFKLPDNFKAYELEIMKRTIPEMLVVLEASDIDTSDIIHMPIKNQFETLTYRFNRMMGVSDPTAKNMLKMENDWKEKVMLLLNKCAEFTGFKCIDVDATVYNEPSLEIREQLFSGYYAYSRDLLQIVHTRFLLLKQFCNFKAQSHNLFHIFNLDVLINVILKNPLNTNSKMLNEERNILIYIDRYMKGGEFTDASVMLSHIAMARIGLHRKETVLIEHHFQQFKELYIKPRIIMNHMHSFMLMKVSEIIKQLINYYESIQEFQKASQAIATLNLLVNTAYKRLVHFHKMYRGKNVEENLKAFISANPNNLLAKELAEGRLISLPLQLFENEKNNINQYCRNKLSELVPKIKIYAAKKTDPSLDLETEFIEKTKTFEQIPQPEEQLIFEEKPITEEPADEQKLLSSLEKEYKTVVSYSETYFLWSSINNKLNIQAKIAMQAQITLTKEELAAALRILQSGRITGAIGNGIKLVTEEEQKKHNLQDYIYKIKHVDLNFRIYGKYYINDGKKEFIFDHVIRGHKNHTKNTPGNIELKTHLSL